MPESTAPSLIGLTGLARSGKDTVGAMLVERYGYTRVAFADGIRDAALALDPIVTMVNTTRTISRTVDKPTLRERVAIALENRRPGDKITIDNELTLSMRLSTIVAEKGWDEAKAIPEVRRTLQRIGSEAGWMIHGKNLWIDLAASKITGPAVITDMRFAHEISWLTSRCGRLWRIERPGNTSSLTGAAATHASEAGDLGREPDATIVNDGTLEELAARVDALMTRKV